MAKRWLIVASGASRGFGRGLCEAALLQAPADVSLDFVLLSRSETSPFDVPRKETGERSIRMLPHRCDLGDLGGLEKTLEEALGSLDPGDYSRAILFNNSGSLEPLASVKSLPGAGLAQLKQAMDLNVTSCMWLTAAFTSRFGEVGPEGSPPNVVVNTSSLLAVESRATMAAYCTGKAAREMFHGVVADEWDSAVLKTLSYAPGPMGTAMMTTLTESSTLEKGLQGQLIDMQQGGALVSASESAAKCMRIVLADEFKSGSRIDYYDDEEAPRKV
ncbi:unnamed protein product [Chrysoparadoxa australica]